MGTEFAFSILGAGAFGAAIDWGFKTTPGGLLVMLGLGFVGGGYNFLRRAMALNKQGAAAYKAAHPGGAKATGNSGRQAGVAHHGPMPEVPTATRRNTPGGMFESEPVEIGEDESPGFEIPPDAAHPFEGLRLDDIVGGDKPKERD